jgi:hypothetical protein
MVRDTDIATFAGIYRLFYNIFEKSIFIVLQYRNQLSGSPILLPVFIDVLDGFKFRFSMLDGIIIKKEKEHDFSFPAAQGGGYFLFGKSHIVAKAPALGSGGLFLMQ